MLIIFTTQTTGSSAFSLPTVWRSFRTVSFHLRECLLPTPDSSRRCAAAVMTLIILVIIDYIPGLSLRASEEAEIIGIDEGEFTTPRARPTRPQADKALPRPQTSAAKPGTTMSSNRGTWTTPTSTPSGRGRRTATRPRPRATASPLCHRAKRTARAPTLRPEPPRSRSRAWYRDGQWAIKYVVNLKPTLSGVLFCGLVVGLGRPTSRCSQSQPHSKVTRVPAACL